jgi:AAA ATPase domain
MQWPSAAGTDPREPVLAGFIVNRERLLATALANDADIAQIVLQGPPGSGKTVLLAQLANRLGERGDAVAWLSMEPADNDAGQLLTRILAALATVLFRAGSSAAETLSRLAVPRDPDDGFVESVAERLPIGEPLWLLLDDTDAAGGPLDGLPGATARHRGRPSPHGARLPVGAAAASLTAGAHLRGVRARLRLAGVPTRGGSGSLRGTWRG